MDYHVHITDNVADDLDRIEGFSAGGKRTVLEAINADVGGRPDEVLSPHPSMNGLYEYEFVLFDSGKVWSFRFVVDVSRRVVSVMQVVFVDYTTVDFPG